MKPTTFFQTLLLALLLAAASNGAMAQADSCAVNVIHTYMNGRVVPWDSVEVKVCLPPCDYPYQYQTFIMYWPDTILANCATRIDEYASVDRMELSQNYPNPCHGVSSVKLTTRTTGNVKLQIMDMQGRLCCQRMEMLPAGEHTLSLTLPRSGMYFVTAVTADGQKSCKVLCVGSEGSNFGIRLASSSSMSVEKVERGGEGMFSMTDRMQITAHITYDGNVLSSAPVYLNCDLDSNSVTHSEWLYQQGSVNIYFTDADTCTNFLLAGETYKVLVSSNVCQPFTDYPIGCEVTFYDSTFRSIPRRHFEQLSGTWNYEGMYKYRYYPTFERIYICTMDETLPPENITSADDPILMDYNTRSLRVSSCDVASISQCNNLANCYDEEIMVNFHCDTVCYAYDLSESGCLWLTPGHFPDTLILVNEISGVYPFIACESPAPPEIDFDCHSLVVVGGTVGGGIGELGASIINQDDRYIITISYLNNAAAIASSGFLRGVVINKIENITDAQFEVIKTKRFYVYEDSLSGCLTDTLQSDTVFIQDYGPGFSALRVQHHLALNCATNSVTIEAAATDNTVNIVYHVDSDESDDCICPNILEYTIAGLTHGITYNIVFWLNDQIIHQQSYMY